jgi:uncharacterized protein
MVTLQFVSYTEIEKLSSVGRIRKLLNIAKQNKIVILQGRLKKDEEAELIKTTMEEINRDFSGIELAVIYPSETKGKANVVDSLKKNVVSMLLGDRLGLTIIGPANIVKEIKKDPNKIQLLTEEKKTNGKKRRK